LAEQGRREKDTQQKSGETLYEGKAHQGKILKNR